MTLVAQVSRPSRPPWPQIGTMLVEAGTNLRQLTLSRIEYPTLGYNVEPVRCSLVGRPCPSKAGATPNPKPTSPSLLQRVCKTPHNCRVDLCQGPHSLLLHLHQCVSQLVGLGASSRSRGHVLRSYGQEQEELGTGNTRIQFPASLVGSHVPIVNVTFPTGEDFGLTAGA